MSTHRSRILIVDDEKVTTRLLKMTLEQTGRYEVRAENDPKLVVAAALEFQPDLILLDLVMPELDGGDVAFAIKEHPALSKIPVVFLTATIMKFELDARGGMMGGYPFFAKPASTQGIVDFIEQNLVH